MFSPVNGKARLFCRPGRASLSFVIMVLRRQEARRKTNKVTPLTLLRRQELLVSVSCPIWVLGSELWSVLLWVNGPVLNYVSVCSGHHKE